MNSTRISMNNAHLSQLSNELNLAPARIAAALKLLNEGNTIPFIARYRKEMTDSLDEVQVRAIKERADYLKEMDDRRQTILESIETQGKLTEQLKDKIASCTTKSALEDLYLPYKPKRRTKATIAKEKGLEPLAALILEQRMQGSPAKEAEGFIDSDKGVEDVEQALQGARHIVAEWISENAEIRAFLRDAFQKNALLVSKVRNDWKDKETKFKQYYEFSELVGKIPSHRYLAIRRGEHEMVLSVHLEIDEEPLLNALERMNTLNPASPYSEQLRLAVEDSYKRLLFPSIESDVRVDLKMSSDRDAVEVFEQNLRHLLLSPPMGTRSVIGIDPGLRTGCKCAAVTTTGKYLDTVTLYLTKGERGVEHAKQDFLHFVKKHDPFAIAIGNGTGNRETESFVKDLLKEAGLTKIIVVQVSECGASVYSASDVAREEFPELDLTIRGAISIARRLQDPLAELVKVEPKSLGVGQYQHDVYQALLDKKLHDVVESCVNLVGVDLNTASPSLLAYVVGIGASLSKKIVKFREEKGMFLSRKQLLDVPGLGARAFEQAAGFLRIGGGSHPLDASAVHPERYELVERMAQDLGVSLEELVGNPQKADAINLSQYMSGDVGNETLKDILDELKKPGRDPRQSFEPPKFRDDVTKPEDLKPGMELEGVVTNVTAFGAFVDIGVHQDGLVHVSQLSDQFIKDPNEAVKAGDRLKVTVLDVDLKLKRISLSAKSQRKTEVKPKEKGRHTPRNVRSAFSQNPFGSL
jgi:protein Tex